MVLRKKAMKRVLKRPNLVISPVFLTPKQTGGYRMVLNLKRLYKYIVNSTFKMENLANILPLLKPNEWAASIDLTDAYLHVPIARSAQHLGFAVGNKFHQYRALPFGLTSAPRIFTRIVQEIVAHLREKGIKIFVYLIVVDSANKLHRHIHVTINLVTNVGFLINYEKSHLTPTQQPEFLCAKLNLPQQLAQPLPHRVHKVRQVGLSILNKPRTTAQHWLQFLGPSGKSHRYRPRVQTENEKNPNRIPRPVSPSQRPNLSISHKQ